MVVYRIEFPDGSFYIGSTVNFAERRSTHLRHGRKGKAVNSALQAKFDQYPICGIYQVACGFARDTLHLLEAEIIEQENPPLNKARPSPLPPPGTGKSKPWGQWPSLHDAARAMNLSYRQMKYLSARYGSLEAHKAYLKRKAEKAPRPEKKPNPLLIEVNGKLGFPKQHLGTLGISRATYRKRRARGESVETALSRGRQHGMQKRYITIDGERLSLREWADRAGIPLGRLYVRLSSGWSEREAVGLAARPVKEPAEPKLVLSKQPTPAQLAVLNRQQAREAKQQARQQKREAKLQSSARRALPDDVDAALYLLHADLAPQLPLPAPTC